MTSPAGTAKRGVLPKVGDRIEFATGVMKGVVGTVKFVGDTKFAQGRWIGVALDFDGRRWQEGRSQHDM